MPPALLRKASPIRIRLALLALALLPVPSFAQTKLFSVDRGTALLREINPQTGATVSNIAMTLPGKTITGATGLATDPVSGQLFALLRLTPFIPDNPGVRELVTVNPITGVVTDIGPAGGAQMGLSFADLAFSSNGTLYGVTGHGSPVSPETLFILSKTTGTATFVRAFGGALDDGESIAFNPSDGMMYRASGKNENMTIPPPPELLFEKYDLGSPGNAPISISPFTVSNLDESTALTHLSGNEFLWADLRFGGSSSPAGRLFRVASASSVALVGQLDHIATGLAFFTPTPVMAVTPLGLDFNGTSGSGLVPRAIDIRASGANVTWSATAALLNGSGWMTLSAQNGTATPSVASKLTVNVDFGVLTTGLYQATITIRNIATNVIATVQVRVIVTTAGQPRLMATPSTAVFLARAGGPAPSPKLLRIFNAGDAPLNWVIPADVQGSAPWLSVAPLSGVAAPGTASSPILFVNSTGLAAGVYQTILRVSSPGSAVESDLVVITLLVVPANAPAKAEAAPYGLIFVAQQGGPPPVSQDFVLSNAGGGSFTFGLLPQTTTGGPWLSASPLGGIAIGPSIITVSVSPTSLNPGIYRGKITATFSSGQAQEIEVLLVVTPAASIAAQSVVPRAAACAPSTMDFVMTTIGNGMSLPVSFPRSLQAQVKDNCDTAVNGATVVANVEGRSIVLRGAGGGMYSGDWVPEREAPAVAVSVVALHPSYPTVQHNYTVATSAAAGGIMLPVLTPDGVVEGAGFTPQWPLAPGGIISIFGQRFASGNNQAGSVPLPTALGGVSVRLSSSDVPLYFAGPEQINAQMPVLARPGDRLSMVVIANGRMTAPQSYLIAPAQPGVFKSGDFAAVLDSQYRVISAQNPARIGDTLQIFATGLGLTDPPASTGEYSPSFSIVQNPVTVTVAGIQLPVAYQGLAPGFVGLYQINAVLNGVTPGTHALVLRQNGIASNSTVPVSIPVQ